MDRDCVRIQGQNIKPGREILDQVTYLIET